MPGEVLNLPLSKIVFFSSLSFISGIALSPLIPLTFLLGIFLFPLRKVGLIGLLLFFLSLGSLYAQSFLERDFLLPEFEGEEVRFLARVVEEDRDVILIEKLTFQGETFYPNEKAALYLDQGFHYGKIIEGKGSPVSFRGEFENFYLKEGISAVFFDLDVKVKGEEPGIRGRVYRIRRSFQRKIEEGLLLPQSGVLKAVLLGDREEISSFWQDKFSYAGVRHLLAISGMHIVIISGLLLSLLEKLNLKEKKYPFSIFLLVLFILMVGAPPSAVRAGIMGSLFLIAPLLGRKRSSFRSLTLAALFMLLFNPLLLKFDIGFQLSFAATLGIMLFSGKIRKEMESIFPGKFSLSKETISTTLSAQIFVFPFLLYYFDYFPFIAPLSNLFIAPLLPAIMVLGFLSLFLSFLIPPLISFLPINFLLSFILFLVDIFSRMGN